MEGPQLSRARRLLCQNHAKFSLPQAIPLNRAAGQALGVLYAMVQRQAAMMAVNDTFWMLSLVFLAMIPIALLLKSTPRVAGPPADGVRQSVAAAAPLGTAVQGRKDVMKSKTALVTGLVRHRRPHSAGKGTHGSATRSL